MDVLLLVISSLAFFWIAWQDFKAKNVLVFSFFIVYVFIGLYIWKYTFPLVENVYINLAVIGFMFSTVGLYYIVRYGLNFHKRLSNSIGLGDLLMLPLIVFVFNPLGFVGFLIISFVASIFYWWILKVFKKRESLIPLAGIQSLFIPCVLWYNLLN